MPTTKKEKILDLLPFAPEESAELAELKYVCDTTAGFSRRKNGKGLVYVDSDGSLIKDEKILDRIKALVIPPAWTDVWICKSKNGHIQATGRDAKGRKQYIYHPKWDEIRNQTKFYRVIKFAESLPMIRERIDNDLRKHGLSREKVMAIIVRLLEETLIRIGNQEYAASGSYGLTTLKDEHVISEGSKLQLIFKGKSGKYWEVDILNKKLARLVKQCQELPGQELFQYIDTEGNCRSATSNDVNSYLCGIIGEEYSAKDFRTWGGTMLAAKELYMLGPAESERDEKKKIVTAIKTVAKALNNTPAICRGYYIHPDILEAYHDGTLFKIMRLSLPDEDNSAGLSREEKSVLKILKAKQKLS